MKKTISPISRRDFLKLAGITGGAVGLAACAPAVAAPTPTMEGMGQTGGTTAEEMDAMHEAGVKTFLDNIGRDNAFWGTKLRPQTEDGFQVFEVKCQHVQWETKPGESVDAMAYNGMVPGPEIRVQEGDNVRVIVTNELNESTSIHFHGVLLPNSMDGVPFITQPPIKPGETFTYEFTAKNPGTHIYHSHHNAAEQVTKGLFGAFIIEPLDVETQPEYDAEYTVTLNDTAIGLTINGKSFPYTQPILAKVGDRIRIRYLNEGLLIHPMHLHGLEQEVWAKDGWNLPQPYKCDTLNIAPGERYDVIVNCHTAGAWAFHCHILTHAESSHGMFGMVTAVVVS